MYVAYFLLLLLYIVKNCSRMLWMICNSNLRISISCNESSVSSAAAAAAVQWRMMYCHHHTML